MEPRTADLLRSLGLSAIECRIYLSLVDRPSGETVEELPALAGSSTFDVEEAIKSLVERRLLKISSNRVEAVEPKIFLNTVLMDKRREAEQSVQEASVTALELEKLLQPIYLEGRLGIKPEELLEPLRDLAEMELRTTRIITNAQSTIFIVAQTFGWYDRIREVLYQALDRRIKVRVLMVMTDAVTKERALELKNLGVEVRRIGEQWYPLRGTLIDESELIFLIWASPKVGVKKPVYYRPHYTRNSGLIRVFSDAFENRWQKSNPI